MSHEFVENFAFPAYNIYSRLVSFTLNNGKEYVNSDLANLILLTIHVASLKITCLLQMANVHICFKDLHIVCLIVTPVKERLVQVRW